MTLNAWTLVISLEEGLSISARVLSLRKAVSRRSSSPETIDRMEYGNAADRRRTEIVSVWMVAISF